jgi:MFS family permease
LSRALDALRVPPFRWWFASQVFGGAGNMTQAVAQAWLVFQLTGSAVDLGVLGACTFGPSLVLGAPAGALVDRVDLRRLLIVTQTLLLLCGAALGLLAAMGAIELWMVFELALAAGAVTAVDSPARQVYVLGLVGADRTASAVSLYEVVINASRVLGPAVGGVLLATVGAAACFFFNAATFLFPIAVLVAQRRIAEGRRVAATDGGVRQGLGYVARTPGIRACILIAIAAGMVFNSGVTLPLLVTHVFHLGAGAYGAMLSAFGLGALPGAVIAASGGRPTGRQVRSLALASGVAVLLTALSPDVLTQAAGMVVLGFLSIWLVAAANTLVQIRSPAPVRGRVMGVWTMALPGMYPLTGLLLGAVAQGVGPREGFGLAGVALVLSAALGWRALRDGAPLTRSVAAPGRTDPSAAGR